MRAASEFAEEPQPFLGEDLGGFRIAASFVSRLLRDRAAMAPYLRLDDAIDLRRDQFFEAKQLSQIVEVNRIAIRWSLGDRLPKIDIWARSCEHAGW